MEATRFHFQTPCNVLVAGVSQSGKSTWVYRVINNKNHFFNDTVKILYCYSVYQDSFKQLENIVQFHKGLPDVEKVADPNVNHVLIILDDLMSHIDEKIVSLFTVQTHHLNISYMFIIQNLFHKNKHMRTISLNAHYITLFRQTRDTNQIGVLARQIFGIDAKQFIEIYNNTMNEPYRYLLIDIHPGNKNRVSVHIDIFPEENEIVYK